MKPSGTSVLRAILISTLAPFLALTAAWAAAPLTFEEVIDAAGFDPQQQAELRAGKIVTRDADEGSDKEMSILVALKAPVSLAEGQRYWRDVKVLDADADLLAVGRIDPDQDPVEALAGVGFSAEEGDEIRGLLKAEPGSDFNLSHDEIDRFQALAKGLSTGGCERDDACRSAVNAAYRQVLAERLTAYREGGIEAVASYARGRTKVAEPSAELRLAAEKMPLVRDKIPDVYRAWLDYPRAQPEDAQHQFLWLKRNVEGRPTFVLTHRAFYQTEGAILTVERHFYAGQFYNSLQMASYTGALSATESIYILLNRTSTDLVAGFGSGAKKMIGRSKVRKALIGTFEKLLADLK